MSWQATNQKYPDEYGTTYSYYAEIPPTIDPDEEDQYDPDTLPSWARDGTEPKPTFETQSPWLNSLRYEKKIAVLRRRARKALSSRFKTADGVDNHKIPLSYMQALMDTNLPTPGQLVIYMRPKDEAPSMLFDTVDRWPAYSVKPLTTCQNEGWNTSDLVTELDEQYLREYSKEENKYYADFPAKKRS